MFSPTRLKNQSRLRVSASWQVADVRLCESLRRLTTQLRHSLGSVYEVAYRHRLVMAGKYGMDDSGLRVGGRVHRVNRGPRDFDHIGGSGQDCAY